MNFIASPITYEKADNGQDQLHPADDGRLVIARDIKGKKAMLDNLVELIVFTPKGKFAADPDFGFEYWQYEYANISIEEFNLDNTGKDHDKHIGDKGRCLISIKDSLERYAPWLTNVKVEMGLGPSDKKHEGGKVYSRHSVTVLVRGEIYDNLGTTVPYEKPVKFLVEPTVKR